MDDLTELSFEKVLSYLSLEDRIRSRAVSRTWRNKIDRFKVRSLCLSDSPSGFIPVKSRLIAGAFAQNFISSPRIESFLNRFANSILSNLKHLRLCVCRSVGFVQTLNSFDQLESLDLFCFNNRSVYREHQFRLKLLQLKSIRLQNVHGIQKLTLDAPRLQKIQLLHSPGYLKLQLVHGESVERLITDDLGHTETRKLKNLLFFYIRYSSEIYPAFLSSLERLKEIHLANRDSISEIFEQKRRYRRTGLKIYLSGCLLDGPDDPAIAALSGHFNTKIFGYLAENQSKLADEIPFFDILDYHNIERVPPESELNVLNRFTQLHAIRVDRKIQDIERFLAFLKTTNIITWLYFSCDQPQELFDRLPDHCAVQDLAISNEDLVDFDFLFRLKDLVELAVDCPIDAESIRKILKELEFLTRFHFRYGIAGVQIDIPPQERPKRFLVKIGERITNGTDLNEAVQFITENSF